VLNFTPHTWSALEEATATLLNDELKTPLTDLQAAWTSYTPTWTASTTNPAIGNGTIAGAYTRIGKTVLFRVNITAGSTTTYGSGQYRISLPVTAGSAAVQLLAGDALIGGAAYDIRGRITSGAPTYTALYCTPTTAGNAWRFVTPTAPATFANGSVLTVCGSYEAA
jgi:hypothetical protein